MKNWRLCTIAAATTAAALSGCSKPGQSASSQAGSPACDLAPKSLAAAAKSAPQDPFEAYGKVLIAKGEPMEATGTQEMSTTEESSLLSDPIHASYQISRAHGGVRVAAGTKLTVTLREQCDAPGEIARAVLASEPAQSEGLNPASRPNGIRSYTWAVPTDTGSLALEEQAGHDDCVVGISDSIQWKTVAVPHADADSQNRTEELPSDPKVAQQAHLPTIKLGEALPSLFPNGTVNKPVVIAVIDTGIDVNHEDLKENLWVNPKEIPGNGKDDDGNGYADDVNGYNFASKIGSPAHQGSWQGVNHGTHVSGLAAARAGNSKGVTGVMGTGAKIMMLNVFGSHDGADGAAIANAIRYAADNGADVINMSLGGEGKDAAYEAAIAYAIKKGSMIVVAAGNETKEVGSKYFAIPAAYAGQYEGLVAVAAIETQTLKLTSYSNWSTSTVEIAAPGSENSKTYTGLLSTLPGNKYGREEGTSMASPVVAGAAALAISTLRDHGYQTSPELIENVLLKSARVDKTLTAKIAEGRVLDVKGLADYINTSYPVVAAPAPAPTATPQPGQPAPSATPAPTAPPVTSSNCPAETTY